jgi:hypothetical protein
MSRLYSSPESLCSCRRGLIRPGARLAAPNHDAVQIHVIDFANHRVQQKTRSPPTGVPRSPDQIVQPAKTSLIVLRDDFA